MSADSGAKSVVTDEVQGELRSIVVNGLLEFLNVTRTGLLRWFKGFHDLEVAVNKVNLTSENCQGLQNYEMALLVRMTEVFEGNDTSNQNPRSLLFGVVLMKKAEVGVPYPYNVRLWEACTPAWKGGDPTCDLNTDEDIRKITDELMISMCKICHEKSSGSTMELLEDS